MLSVGGLGIFKCVGVAIGLVARGHGALLHAREQDFGSG